jgi:hypothetical protein
MRRHQRQIDLCNAALDSVRSIIPSDLCRDVDEYINRFDEWGLGVEILIDQISEFEIKITQEQFSHIYAAMDSMGLAKSDRVNYLRNHGIVA